MKFLKLGLISGAILKVESDKYRKFSNTARKVLVSSKMKNYEGYSKFDALNSPFLESMTFGSKWMRLFFTQAVKECPFHIRPALGVKVSRNPKGIALFARGHLDMYEASGEAFFLEEGVRLCDWLIANSSPGHGFFCWGYNFVWQNTIFLQDRFEPNVVVTIFVGEALIHAYRVTGERRFLDAAKSVAEFIVSEVPRIYETEEEIAIAYVLRPVDAVVLNNNVLAGGFLVKVWGETGEENLKKTACRLMEYTVRRKTAYHAWYYTEPKEKSSIRHDNYHTGGILDGLLEYRELTGDDRFDESYWNGLRYYERNLFLEDGSPKWMNDRVYPLDVHGAAQGIITFAKASRHQRKYLGLAEKIGDWAIRRLYREKTGDFSYRIGKFLAWEYIWDYTLMRWCNAWMTHALGTILLACGNFSLSGDCRASAGGIRVHPEGKRGSI